MATRAEINPQVEEERYLALLRAANAIANSDCDSAFHTLSARLCDVTSFDYLHLVAFDDARKVPPGRCLRRTARGSTFLARPPLLSLWMIARLPTRMNRDSVW